MDKDRGEEAPEARGGRGGEGRQRSGCQGKNLAKYLPRDLLTGTETLARLSRA